MRALLLLLLALPAQAQEWRTFTPVGYSEYVVPAGYPLTIRWAPSDGATSYEWETQSLERSAERYSGNTPQESVIWTLPKVGHYSIRVRACNSAGCSDWADSTNETYARVMDAPRAFVVYAYLAAPTGGGIN